jgi:putative flippase GtrA
MPLKPELVRRVVRFAVVGATVMVVFTGLNWGLGRWCGATVAFLLAYPPAVALHFALNKWWTFGCERSDLGRQVGEYLLMVAVTFVVQFGLFRVAHDVLGWPGWLAAGGANAGQMALSFLIMQRRVFAAPSAPSSAGAAGAGTGWFVAGVLLAAGALRAFLAFRGGQLFWGDEQIRYGSAQTAYAALVAGDWSAGLREILGHADHPLFRLWSLPGAALQHHGLGSHAAAAAVASLFSVGVLALVWAVARRAGAGTGEARLALVLAASSSTLLFYSRHLLPYDMALAFLLGGLWCGLAVRPRGLLAAGGLVGLGFLTYTGYWLMGAVVLVLGVLAGAGGLRVRLQRALAGLVGLALPLGLWALAGALGDYGLAAKLREFSGTVTQGDFGDGHRVLAGYLVSAEGGLLLLWLAAGAWALRGGGEPAARRRAVLWLAGAGALALGLVVLSDVLRHFVVYGRLVRCLVPFLCLAAAAGLARLPAPARNLAVLAALALAAVNLAVPLAQVFPDRFRTQAWAVVAAAEAGDPRVWSVVRTEHLPTPKWWTPLPAHEVVRRSPHPLEFPPYRFEGFTRSQRDAMERAEISPRLIRLAVPPPPARDAARWGAHPGPLRLSFRLPQDRVGLTDPLLVSGAPGKADFVYVQYLAADRIRLGFDHWGTDGVLSPPLTVDPDAVQTLVVSTGPLLPGPGVLAPEEEQVVASLRRRLVVMLNGEPVFSRPADFHPARPGSLQVAANLVGGSSCGPEFAGQFLAVESAPLEELLPRVPEAAGLVAARDAAWAGAPGPFEIRLDLGTVVAGEPEPLVGVEAESGNAVLLVERLDATRARLGYERFGAGVVWSEPVAFQPGAWQRLEVAVGGLMPEPAAPLYRRQPAVQRLRDMVHVRFDGAPVLTWVHPDVGRVRAVSLGWNGVGSGLARPRLTANVAEVRPLDPAALLAQTVALAGAAGRPEAAWGGWPGGLRLRLRFPSDRVRQAEPLLVRGVPGAGDILYVQYVDEGQVRFGLDHWGSGGPLSAPVPVRPGAEHEVVVLADLLLPPAQSGAAGPPGVDALRGVLRVALDGRVVLAGAAPAHPAELGSLTLGTNFIGGSTAGPAFTGRIAAVAPLDDAELQDWRRREP